MKRVYNGKSRFTKRASEAPFSNDQAVVNTALSFLNDRFGGQWNELRFWFRDDILDELEKYLSGHPAEGIIADIHAYLTYDMAFEGPQAIRDEMLPKLLNHALRHFGGSTSAAAEADESEIEEALYETLERFYYEDRNLYGELREKFFEHIGKTSNLNTERKNAMNRRNRKNLVANRRVAEYDPTDAFYNEGVWEVANEVWNSRFLSYDVTDQMIEEKIRDYSEFFLGQQADQTFVDMVMDILNKNRNRTSRRANRKVASNPLFIRLLASRGVYGVGISGDIMAYVDLPIDENGTNFYWVVIDSNGDEIVGGSSSSFEEAKSLAENNLFRLSRELYPESYTSHKANRKIAEYDPTNVFQNEGVWEIAEMVWDSRLLSYDVSDEVIEETIRDYSETFLGEVADTYFVDSVMSILKENLKQSNHRANLKVSYSKEDEFEVHDEVVEKFPGGESALADLFDYTNLDQAETNSAKVMPYIEDAVFSRGGDQDDVDFAYDNLEYYFQTEY